jgi:transposase
MRARRLEMGKRRRTLDEQESHPEQIVRKLRQADEKLASGASVPEVARELGVSETTYHRWSNRYGGMDPSETKPSRSSKRRTPA